MIPYTTAAEAAALIKSGERVYVQGSTSVPELLVDAMTAQADRLRGVEVYSSFCITDRVAPYATERYAESFRPYTFFVGSNLRQAVADGYAEAIPAFLGEIPAMIRSGRITIDTVLLNVSPPDSEGYCSFGISADLTVAATESARTVIAQINPRIPYSYGDARIHISRLTAAVECSSEPCALPCGKPNETECAIGRNIAEMIPDGATLQIGVGGIPNAILSFLVDRKHLGLHTEALTDGVVPLVESGVIDNSKKRVLPGKTVASLAVGSSRLYDFMDYNRDIVMRDVAWTNDPAVIKRNPKVMAINSAVELDLTGQVCADSIGERIYSGVGGQHDFMYGGSLSEGGRTFIAIPSMTSGGISKIKAVLTGGAGVVTTRCLVQYIVTEYGVADLRAKSYPQRAKALIEIAHPSVRENLDRAARLRFGRAYHSRL